MKAFFLQGYDDYDGSTVYWTWTDPDGVDHLCAQDRAVVDAAIAKLRAALPWEDATLADLDLTELNDQLRAANLSDALTDWLGWHSGAMETNARLVLTFHRVATGALADPVTERVLAHEIGQALLPPDLVSALRAASRAASREGGIPKREDDPQGSRLTVLPARSCSAVPWAWLGTAVESDERLVELADVVIMGPALHRDGRADLPHPSWEDQCDLPILCVVDPAGGHIPSVLRCDDGVAQTRLWQAEVDATGQQSLRVPGLVNSEAATRRWLFDELRERSAALFLGHVVSARSDVTGVGDAAAGKAGLLLAPAHHDGSAPDTLTAAEIVSSLIAPDEGDPSRGYAAGSPRAWQWPPRVGLVACQSGSDLSFAEPFGLVTAILEAGAELVLATLWPLFTDTMFVLASGEPAESFTQTPLFDLSMATRDVLTSPHPFDDFAGWQRSRLAAWRAAPSLTTAPITWAAAALHYAPDRTPRPMG